MQRSKYFSPVYITTQLRTSVASSFIWDPVVFLIIHLKDPDATSLIVTGPALELAITTDVAKTDVFEIVILN